MAEVSRLQVLSMDGFVKDELVRYSNFEYPFRIKAFEEGHVAWIAETYGTKYVSGGRVAHIWRVPIDHLGKIEQQLGKIKE